MNEKYAPAEVEAAAQAHWAATDAFRVVEHPNKPKFYACSMLPYPSGKLHMGHVRNYTINDMMARYLRMKGMNVLMPMGWDAFGLPAENAAIDNNVPPAQWTRANIADMKSQMQPLGLAFDWQREVATCDPGYYKWNQWFFLKMLEKGIAYKKTQIVNWDPIDQTVLANEQVVDGRGWRSGAIVEKREIPGYYLAITQYADELLAGVNDSTSAALPGRLARTRAADAGTLDRQERGRALRVPARDPRRQRRADPGRPPARVHDARRHHQGRHLLRRRARASAGHAGRAANPALAAFIEECKKGGTTEAELALKDKEGRPTGLFVTHPLTGTQVPVWVGNYVLMSYGDGAVMGVPAHDERDFAFAKKYGIDMLQVVHVDGEHFSYDHWQDWYADKTRGITINSGNYSGLSYKAAVDAIAAALQAKGLGEKKTTWRLRDWGISRQRYWGTPIPIIHCAELRRRAGARGRPAGGAARGPGARRQRQPAEQVRRVPRTCACPQCGQPARRETDTMDTFVDSSWYYMRYCCPDSDDGDGRRAQRVLDADGPVHRRHRARRAAPAVRALLDQGDARPGPGQLQRAVQEPVHAGHAAQRVASTARTTPARSAGSTRARSRCSYDDRGHPVGATARSDGLPVMLGGIEKMSKSKNNVVEPKDIIAKFGADTARVFTMFAGPPDQSAAWSDSGAEGVFRFLRRLWAFGVKQAPRLRGPVVAASGTNALRYEVHMLLRQITHDYDRMQYNTVVSGAMKLLNALEDGAAAADDATLREGVGILLRTLYPAAPHITHGLWDRARLRRQPGHADRRALAAVDEAALVQERDRAGAAGRRQAARGHPRAGRRRPRGHRGRGAGDARVREVLRRQAREEGRDRAGPAGECRRLTPAAGCWPAPARWPCRPWHSPAAASSAGSRRCWPSAASR